MGPFLTAILFIILSPQSHASTYLLSTVPLQMTGDKKIYTEFLLLTVRIFSPCFPHFWRSCSFHRSLPPTLWEETWSLSQFFFPRGLRENFCKSTKDIAYLWQAPLGAEKQSAGGCVLTSWFHDWCVQVCGSSAILSTEGTPERQNESSCSATLLPRQRWLQKFTMPVFGE